MMRFLGEYATVQVLGKSLPRKLRRICGRAYASAAYRVRHGINTRAYRYRKFIAHPAITQAIIKEMDKFVIAQKAQAESVPLPPQIILPGRGVE
jgi:hypothetical protein